MIIKNGNVVTPYEILNGTDIKITNGKIAGIGKYHPEPDEPVIDAAGLYVCPGFVDIHTHGGFGGDFMDATEEAFDNACAFHISNGTTSILATTVTVPVDQITDMLTVLRSYKNRENPTCRILDAHIEGPYISYKNKGAQHEQYLRIPDRDDYSFITDNADVIKTVTIAPELDGAAKMTADLKAKGIIVCGGHDDGEKSKIMPVIDAGLSHCTHLWCAMSVVAMRDGVRSVGLCELGLIDDRLTVELIADNHHITGYWFGADSESVADGLMNTPQDRIIPGGYEFYRQWHRYLKDQGVDFIKVDCQGNAAEFLKNDPAAFEKVGVIMDGLEQSAVENFDFMINCMGMNNLNAHQHRSSVLLRNSDDFFPNKPEGFREHAVNNIYNAVFTDELFYCDYDMWWSDHADAKRSAALRFLSGGPVYVSDAPDKTDRTPMEPFLAEDGLFRRPVQALKPTYDCLFGFDKVLKAFTKVDNGYAVALFSFEEAGQTMLSAADFGEDGRWQITELYGGASFSLQPSQATEVSLAPADVKVYHLTRR